MYVYTNNVYLNIPDLGFEANVYFLQRQCMIMMIISIILFLFVVCQTQQNRTWWYFDMFNYMSQ